MRSKQAISKPRIRPGWRVEPDEVMNTCVHIVALNGTTALAALWLLAQQHAPESKIAEFMQPTAPTPAEELQFALKAVRASELELAMQFVVAALLMSAGAFVVGRFVHLGRPGELGERAADAVVLIAFQPFLLALGIIHYLRAEAATGFPFAPSSAIEWLFPLASSGFALFIMWAVATARQRSRETLHRR